MKYITYIILSSAFIPLACSTISLNQRIHPTASDWTMAGGSPEQQNVSGTVLKPPLSLVWRYNCDAGIGNSAVSVADAVVFVNTLQGEMHSIDISSGAKLGYINFLGKDANTTPLIDNNNVIVTYAGDNKYSMASYNLLLGELNWRVNLGYLETSPLPYEGYLYAGSLDGKEYKIDKSTGARLWSFNAGSAIHSTCAIENKKLVFGTDNGMIYCLNSKDGTLFWKYKTGNSIFSAPLIFNNNLFVGSFDSNYYCITLDSGTTVWKRNLSTKLITGSALFGNTSVLFGGVDGNLYCLNEKDGELVWKFQTKGAIASTPLVSGVNVYFTSYDSYLYCVSCSGGQMVWNYQLDGKSKTSPVIWNNYLFTGSDYYVYCFSNRSP